MPEDVEHRFEEILEIARTNELDLDMINKAFQKAKQLHQGQKRKDGAPYISHPVEVALILAKLNFDENVVAAALLHDTIEDCSYTPEQMKNEFNETIFNLVDCVSAIDKTKYVFDEENIYEDVDFVKSSVEEQTFKKLIKLGKENPCGFAIKFADRLHNLSTISIFEYPKQLEKVRETEKWVLPIAKALKSGYFYKQIKNECFKIVNNIKLKDFFEDYLDYHKCNERNINKILLELKAQFTNTDVKSIEIEDIDECCIYESLLKKNRKINSKISKGHIIQFSNYNIFFIYKEGMFKNLIGEVINKLNIYKNLKIIECDKDSLFDKMFFTAVDKLKNKYDIYLLTEKEYLLSKVGTLDGQNLEKIDEDNINDLERDLIRVKTRSGEVKYIAKDSTVLDFAFKIHKDIGLTFKYAIVNGSKTKLPPYTKLNEDDRVEIITDKKTNGEPIINAKLKWLAYVNTELAKKVLIKYFEKYLND